jgi:hypothetical protein
VSQSATGRGARLALPLASACAALLLALPAAAVGQQQQSVPSLTDDFSAADQYVESVPTSRGPKAPGVDRKPKRSKAPLPPAVESKLGAQPEETAAKLEQIATSPELGAPVERLQEGRKPSPRVPAATVSAVEDGAGASLTWLVVALLAITGIAVGTAAYRHHRARRTIG